MTTALTVNGVVFNYPQVDDIEWGEDATGWASAVTAGMLQKSGGLFSLTAEVDFGPNFGIKSSYLKSRTSNVAATGLIRLAVSDTITWRNNANSADLALAVDGSNNLTFNGATFITTTGTQTLTNKTLIDAVITDTTAVQYDIVEFDASLNMEPRALTPVSGMYTDGNGRITTVPIVANGMLVANSTYTTLEMFKGLYKTELTTTGASTSTLVPFTLNTGEGRMFNLTVSGTYTSGSEAYIKTIGGVFFRGLATAILSDLHETVTYTAGASNWSVLVVRSGNTLEIRITGQNLLTVEWSVRMDYMEII